MSDYHWHKTTSEISASCAGGGDGGVNIVKWPPKKE